MMDAEARLAAVFGAGAAPVRDPSFTLAVIRGAEAARFKAAAAAVGVGDQSLRAWHVKFAPALPPCGENASVEELQAENARLRKQLQRAEMEREILKKATAYFAKESL